VRVDHDLSVLNDVNQARDPFEAEPPPSPAEVDDTGLARRFKLRRDLSTAYVLASAIGTTVMLVASVIGILPWPVSITLIGLMATTFIQGGRTLAMIGGVVAVVVIVVSLVSSLTAPAPEPVVAIPTAPVDPNPAIPGSLGIYMDQVAESWNTVETPPEIVKGLTRFSETGEYDTFVYRFGEWGRLAGAYDPANDMIYALMASGYLSKPATSQLYLHVCHLVAPYSPECIDSYHARGLDGKALTDYAGLPHQSEWTVGEHTWRLQIEGDLFTLRVFGADAA
jgi:hypothetical protein